MLAFDQSANLLAVLLLPYSIPVDVVIVFLCSLLLIFAAAVIGARATAEPFRWRRVVDATLGVMMGAVLSPWLLACPVYSRILQHDLQMMHYRPPTWGWRSQAFCSFS